jgi:hydrogenase-4 component E
MLLAHLSPLAASLFSLLAIGSLLLEGLSARVHGRVVADRSALRRGGLLRQLSRAVSDRAPHRVFSGPGAALSDLAIIIRLEVERELHVILQPSSSIVLGALLVLFAFVVSNHLGNALGLGGTVVVLALTVMLSMKLIGFLMLAVRHEAISQVLGLLILENGIFLGSQILVPGMPMLIELVLLFDLLVIVVSFGVLVRYLVAHVGSTSSRELRRLVG